jgi:hypothetical protein
MAYLYLGFYRTNCDISEIATKLVKLQAVNAIDIIPSICELAKSAKACLAKEALRWPKYRNRDRDLEIIEELTKLIERLLK